MDEGGGRETEMQNKENYGYFNGNKHNIKQVTRDNKIQLDEEEGSNPCKQMKTPAEKEDSFICEIFHHKPRGKHKTNLEQRHEK